MAKITPQTRAIRELESRGYIVDVIERIQRRGPVTWRNDLFGAFDLLACGIGERGGWHTLAVQVTSRSNVSARVKKIAELPAMPYLRQCQWAMEVWGWGPTKTKGDWLVVDVS